MPNVDFNDFSRIDIRIGTILEAERVPGSKKLIKLSVDLGSETRQIVAGMAEFLSPEDMAGKQVPVIANLEPRKMMGIMSEGMILAADVGGRPVLLRPENQVPSGSVVR
jgi:methionine--tRNA ligase beta chain